MTTSTSTEDAERPIKTYIESQYSQVLKRKPTEQEVKYYLDAIITNRMKQTDVSVHLRTSDEFKRQDLNKLYREILDRDIDEDGAKHYMNQLKTRRGTMMSIKKELITSEEYFKKFLGERMPMNNFRIPAPMRKRFVDEFTDGFAKMKERKVVIAGLLRDRVRVVDHLRRHSEMIGELFKDYRVIVVENDSVDGTRQKLDEWQKQNNKVVIIGGKMNLMRTTNRSGANPRIGKMVLLRNMYLEYVENHLSDFDYLIVNDMDIFGSCYHEGIASSIHHMEKNQDADMIACNGCFFNQDRNPDRSYNKNYVYYRLEYYDTFPYVPVGTQYIWNTEREKLQHDRDYIRYTANRYKLGDPIERLLSAFAGLAIYRIRSLKGHSYQLAKNKISCEHSMLNVQLKTCYINPSMIYFILEF